MLQIEGDMQDLTSVTTSTVRPPGPISDDDPAFGPKKFHWTRDEYYRIAELGVFEGKRVELIEGEIIEMAPMGSIHATVIAIVSEILREHFHEGYHVRSQSPLDVDKFSQPEPDVAVLPGISRNYLEGHPKSLALAVEVSVSSISLDREIKTRLYAKAGIEDYWIVNINEKCVEVYRKPFNDPEKGFIYREQAVFGADQSISPLAKPEVLIKVADILP